MSISKPISILFAILFAMPAVLLGQVFSNESTIFGPVVNDVQNSFITLDIEDINNDGLNDILYGNDLNFTLYKNIGNLEFEELGVLNGLPFADIVHMVDVNGDSYKDFVSNNGVGLLWIENSADGFLSNNTQDLFDTTTEILQFEFADIEGDGDLDIFFIDFDSDKIYLVPNLGNGQFGPETVVYESSDEQIRLFFVNDMDSDSDIDILFVTPDGGIRSITNSGNSEFALGSVVTEDFFFLGPVLFPNDIDNDGLTDLVVADDLTINLSWMKQLSNGEFAAPDTISFNFPFADVNLTDFDNDGDIDISLVSLLSQESKVAWFENNGSGDFTEHIINDGDFSLLESESNDIDGDGDVDLVGILEDQNMDGQFILFENFMGVGRIEGCIYFDENENGIMDSEEQNLNGIQVGLEPNGLLKQTNKDGCYTFFIDDGTYVVSPSPSSLWELTTDSASFTVTVEGASVSDLNFGLSPREQLLAGQMHTVSGITRCNRETKFDFIFQNVGTTIIEEGIIWGFPDSLLTIANQLNPLDTFVNDFQWGWKFEKLFPGQTIRRSIELNIPGLGNGIDPGTLVTMFSATEATDTQGFTNFFKHNFESEILCAYDPNDKLIRPDRVGDENYTQFKDTLIYTVRFQNTGNDTAFTVVLRDTLDQNLDVNTFRLLGSSHGEILTTEILEERFMTFTFEDILLPDSTVNFNGSQGFVSYSIRAKDPIPENTVIENTASIFFDFNPPIVTNTTQNTMVECLPINQEEVSVSIGIGETYTLPDGSVVSESGSYVTDVLDDDGCPIETVLTILEVLTSTSNLVWNRYVNVVPNPTRDFFYLDIEVDAAIDHELVIFNILGEEVHRQTIQTKSNLVDLQSFSSGTYMMQLIDKQNEVVALRKLVVM